MNTYQMWISATIEIKAKTPEQALTKYRMMLKKNITKSIYIQPNLENENNFEIEHGIEHHSIFE